MNQLLLRTLSTQNKRLCIRYYATKESTSFKERFLEKLPLWNKMMKKRQNEQSLEPSIKLQSKPVSIESAFRKGNLTATQHAQKKKRGARRRSSKKPADLLPDQVIQSLVNELELSHLKLSEIDISSKNLTLKAKFIGRIVTQCQIHLSNVEITDLSNVEELLQLCLKPRGLLVKNPVAHWFLDQQKHMQLPPNLEFVPYRKADKLKLRALY